MKYEVTLCESDSRAIWLSLLFGYKGVIQAIGIFLALRIRNVKVHAIYNGTCFSAKFYYFLYDIFNCICTLPCQIKVLNDSKEIAATLYLSSAVLAVVLIISLALPTHLTIYSASYSFGIPLATSVVLIVVFFTKVGFSTSTFTFTLFFFVCVCVCVCVCV